MVGIYKFVGELPARMGGAMSEAQGRGSLWRTAACDVCFTPLTPGAVRLRSAAPDPPFGKKGGLILVPRDRAENLIWVGGRDFSLRAAGATLLLLRNSGRQRMPLRRATGEGVYYCR